MVTCLGLLVRIECGPVLAAALMAFRFGVGSRLHELRDPVSSLGRLLTRFLGRVAEQLVTATPREVHLPHRCAGDVWQRVLVLPRRCFLGQLSVLHTPLSTP